MQMFKLSIPGFRPDLEREVDLIEEVARLLVLINSIRLPLIRMQTNDLPVQEQINRKIRYSLSAMGLHECLSLRFTSKNSLKMFLVNQMKKTLVVHLPLY